MQLSSQIVDKWVSTEWSEYRCGLKLDPKFASHVSQIMQEKPEIAARGWEVDDLAQLQSRYASTKIVDGKVDDSHRSAVLAALLSGTGFLHDGKEEVSEKFSLLCAAQTEWISDDALPADPFALPVPSTQWSLLLTAVVRQLVRLHVTISPTLAKWAMFYAIHSFQEYVLATLSRSQQPKRLAQIHTQLAISTALLEKLSTTGCTLGGGHLLHVLLSQVWKPLEPVFRNARLDLQFRKDMCTRLVKLIASILACGLSQPQQPDAVMSMTRLFRRVDDILSGFAEGDECATLTVLAHLSASPQHAWAMGHVCNGLLRECRQLDLPPALITFVRVLQNLLYNTRTLPAGFMESAEVPVTKISEFKLAAGGDKVSFHSTARWPKHTDVRYVVQYAWYDTLYNRVREDGSDLEGLTVHHFRSAEEHRAYVKRRESIRAARDWMISVAKNDFGEDPSATLKTFQSVLAAEVAAAVPAVEVKKPAAQPSAKPISTKPPAASTSKVPHPSKLEPKVVAPPPSRMSAAIQILYKPAHDALRVELEKLSIPSTHHGFSATFSYSGGHSAETPFNNGSSSGWDLWPYTDRQRLVEAAQHHKAWCEEHATRETAHCLFGRFSGVTDPLNSMELMDPRPGSLLPKTLLRHDDVLHELLQIDVPLPKSTTSITDFLQKLPADVTWDDLWSAFVYVPWHCFHHRQLVYGPELCDALQATNLHAYITSSSGTTPSQVSVALHSLAFYLHQPGVLSSWMYQFTKDQLRHLTGYESVVAVPGYVGTRGPYRIASDTTHVLAKTSFVLNWLLNQHNVPVLPIPSLLVTTEPGEKKQSSVATPLKRKRGPNMREWDEWLETSPASRELEAAAMNGQLYYVHERIFKQPLSSSDSSSKDAFGAGHLWTDETFKAIRAAGTLLPGELAVNPTWPADRKPFFTLVDLLWDGATLAAIEVIDLICLFCALQFMEVTYPDSVRRQWVSGKREEAAPSDDENDEEEDDNDGRTAKKMKTEAKAPPPPPPADADSHPWPRVCPRVDLFQLFRLMLSNEEAAEVWNSYLNVLHELGLKSYPRQWTALFEPTIASKRKIKKLKQLRSVCSTPAVPMRSATGETGDTAKKKESLASVAKACMKRMLVDNGGKSRSNPMLRERLHTWLTRCLNALVALPVDDCVLYGSHDRPSVKLPDGRLVSVHEYVKSLNEQKAPIQGFSDPRVAVSSATKAKVIWQCMILKAVINVIPYSKKLSLFCSFEPQRTGLYPEKKGLNLQIGRYCAGPRSVPVSELTETSLQQIMKSIVKTLRARTVLRVAHATHGHNIHEERKRVRTIQEVDKYLGQWGLGGLIHRHNTTKISKMFNAALDYLDECPPPPKPQRPLEAPAPIPSVKEEPNK